VIEAGEAGSDLHRQYVVNKFLDNFFSLVESQSGFFQWMEVVIDWVIKVTFRVPLMRDWMQQNASRWAFLLDWLKQNPTPPMQQQYQDRVIRMNKPRSRVSTSAFRYNSRRNQALCFYRKNSLI